jgi:hypothetical protein
MAKIVVIKKRGEKKYWKCHDKKMALNNDVKYKVGYIVWTTTIPNLLVYLLIIDGGWVR